MFCLDCNAIRELDTHGRCRNCGSDAVCYPEALRPQPKPEDWIARAIEDAAAMRGSE